MIFKRIIAFACVVTCCINYSVYSYAIHKDDFKFEIRKFAESYISSLPIDKKFNVYDIPTQLKPEYENCLVNANERLDDMLWSQGDLYLEHKELEKVTRQEIDKFTKTMSYIVLKYNLDEKINNAICDLMHKNGITKNDMQKHAAGEYDSRYYKVKEKLNKIMSNDYRSYVRINEIEKAVSDEFLVLIKRVKNQENRTEKKPVQKTNYSWQDTQPAQKTEYSWQDFWDWITGKNTTVNTSTPEPSAPPYDYAGEKCSICLENIKSYERLGYLNCGHYFHESCINTSFSHYAHKCPLCDTYADSVAHTVVVPLQ